MPETVQLALIQLIGTVAGAILALLTLIFTMRNARQVAAVHTLVNSNMGVQLKLTALALRNVARLTKNEADVRAADDADKLVVDHDAKQALVDSGKT